MRGQMQDARGLDFLQSSFRGVSTGARPLRNISKQVCNLFEITEPVLSRTGGLIIRLIESGMGVSSVASKARSIIAELVLVTT